ncbi:MAG: type II toxin-antitoxin system RatA family toxin [Gammaproteobacteria bacterium]|nr:type II toxin-antitoxin system RatA family toxin [Gammaproteobacteria bacterium]
MREISRSALVPCQPEQMFELVADVEQYPEFVPHCQDATLIARNATELTGRITVSEGPFHTSFTTRNQLEAPRRMTIELVHGPFSELHGEWRFEPMGDAGCKVELRLQFGFANRVKDLVLGAAFEQTCNHLVDAFVARAGQLYG